jgi:ribosomal protein S18 acetylase RimI-like enzyme
MQPRTPNSAPHMNQFNLAKPEHSKEISFLVNSAYRGESSKVGWTTEADFLGGQRTDPASIEELIFKKDSTLLIKINTQNAIIACVHLEKKNSHTTYLGMLTVNPTLQAKGIGKALLKEAEDYSKNYFQSSKIEMTVIQLRPELIAWYERYGYKKTGETRPFPMGDPKFGLPKQELYFIVLEKTL